MEFAGISQEDKQRLERAARMYTNATGEDVTSVVSAIPVQPDEANSAEAKAAKAEEELKWSAEAQSSLDKAHQQERRLAIQQAAGFPAATAAPPSQPVLTPNHPKATAGRQTRARA